MKNEIIKIREMIDTLNSVSKNETFIPMELSGIKTNLHSPVRLNETSLKRLFDLHNQNGFVIISASRSDWDTTDTIKNAELNNNKTKELLNIIRTSKWSYSMVYGGFIETTKNEISEEDNEVKKHVYETSFMIFNYTKNGDIGNIDELFEFGTKLCGMFNQESFMFKGIGGSVPMWVDKNGEQTYGRFTGNYTLNDIAQEYFTSLIKTKELLPKTSTKEKHTTFPETIKRFTHEVVFEGLYCNPPYCTLNERRVRASGGEILIMESW